MLCVVGVSCVSACVVCVCSVCVVYVCMCVCLCCVCCECMMCVCFVHMHACYVPAVILGGLYPSFHLIPFSCEMEENDFTN